MVDVKVERIRDKIADLYGFRANVVLANYYVDGSQHVGWHADNEEDLVEGSPIATVSLGQSRKFEIRHKNDSMKGTLQSELRKRIKESGDNLVLTEEEEALLTYRVGEDTTLNKSIWLNHGDLLVMCGDMQKHWRHRVPRVKEDIGPRIVFTFRVVEEDALVEAHN